jgi:hypothetical protein
MGVKMRLRTLIILLGIALVGSGASAIASESKPQHTVGPVSGELFKLETTCDRLSHSIDLWHDATLRGNEGNIEKYFGEIVSMVDQDIVASRRLLKLFAQETLLLQQAATDVEERNLLEEEAQQEEMRATREAIEQLAALINTKMALKEALDNSVAFSNRYRLLGDYINLLRKELEIPKVKLAYEMIQSSDKVAN